MKTKAEILRPYQTFDLDPIREEYDVTESFEIPKRDCILLSGPPGAGKSTVIGALIKRYFGDSITVVTSSDSIYSVARMLGLPDTHLEYGEFKKLPMGRERLIAVSDRMKMYDSELIWKIQARRESWKNARALLVDNVGFPYEVDFFKMHSDRAVLLEVTEPYILPANSHYQVRGTTHSKYMDARDNGTTWPGDSRHSLAKYGTEVLGKNKVYSTIASEYMEKFLVKQLFESDKDFLTAGIGYTAIGTMYAIWRDAIENKTQGDLFNS